VGHIAPNPRQPRGAIDPTSLQELSDSIKEHGVIQPLVVTRVTPDSPQDEISYQLIAGERRLEAAKLAGLEQVPVVVKEASDQETLELALVENIQRSDLNPLEEADAYQQLTSDFGLTQEEVARRVGKSRTAVTNSLRLLALDNTIKGALSSGEISEGHARALLGLPYEEARLHLLGRIAKEGLNVRQTEEAVRRLADDRPPRPTRRNALKDAATRDLEERFRVALGAKVNLSRGRKGGRLTIYFYSEEELDGLYNAIVGQ
jgi:ParB family chromosome partitioning protein